MDSLAAEVKGMISKSYLDSFWVVPGMFSPRNLTSHTDIPVALVVGAQILALLPMVFTKGRHSDD